MPLYFDVAGANRGCDGAQQRFHRDDPRQRFYNQKNMETRKKVGIHGHAMEYDDCNGMECQGLAWDEMRRNGMACRGLYGNVMAGPGARYDGTA